MSDIVTKYASFVDILLQKTGESKIPWSYDSTRREISVWNGDTLLNITKNQDDNFEDLYHLALFNRAGDFLEGFDDTIFSNTFVAMGKDNYFVRMKNLFNLAMRQATGADKALDDFISAVNNDSLDFPF